MTRDKPLKGRRAVVLGASPAGLAAAISLASAGARVRLLEPSDRCGGVLQDLRIGDFNFHLGHEFMTSTQVLARLFSLADHRLSDFITFRPCDPGARLLLKDKRHLDLYRETEALAAELARFSPKDAEHFRKLWSRFEAEALDAEEHLFLVPSTGKWRWRKMLSTVSGIRVFKSAFYMHSFARYLRKNYEHHGVYDVYRTYLARLGTTPYSGGKMLRALATLEHCRGFWAPEGGMNALVEGLVRLAREKGVKIHFNTSVLEIETEQRFIRTVRTDSLPEMKADLVISTDDPRRVLTTYFEATKSRVEELKSYRGKKPSPSQLAFFWGLRREIPELNNLQTILLGENDRETDRQLLRWGVAPAEPDLVITNENAINPGSAPPGKQALKITQLAPHLTNRFAWTKQAVSRERTRLLKRLAEQGINISENDFLEEYCITPADWQGLTGVAHGSLFGTGLLRRGDWARRFPNKSASVHGLYYAGEFTHPGPTLPLTLTGGMLAVELAIRDFSRAGTIAEDS
ncbi:MAG: phytoene desaturase family protein [Sumerlaeia bacterium]